MKITLDIPGITEADEAEVRCAFAAKLYEIRNLLETGGSIG